MVQASGDERRRGAADDPGAARRAPRPARAPRADRARGGAVEGEVFHHGASRRSRPSEPRLTAQLTALVRKEFVRPDRPALAGEDAFRFRHLLLRDAAYDAIPKAERAELHERFADWLDEHGRRARRARRAASATTSSRPTATAQELGRIDEHARGLARRAGERLGAAGERAVVREDFRAGRNLLERAADLSARRPTRWTIRDRPRLGALQYRRDCQRRRRVSPRPSHARPRRTTASTSSRSVWSEETSSARAVVGLRQRTPKARRGGAPGLRGCRTDWGLTIACGALLIAAEIQGRSCSELLAVSERIVTHARRADDPLWINWGETRIPIVPVPRRDSGGRVRALARRPSAGRAASVLPYRHRLLAMLGRFDEARTAARPE